ALLRLLPDTSATNIETVFRPIGTALTPGDFGNKISLKAKFHKSSAIYKFLNSARYRANQENIYYSRESIASYIDRPTSDLDFIHLPQFASQLIGHEIPFRFILKGE